jgi:hypothetical protein
VCFDNVIFIQKVHLINNAISEAQPGSPLYQKRFVNDPSKRLIETHVAALQWHMQSRKFEMTAATLIKLQGMSVSLLELLKQNLPVKRRGRRLEIREGTQYSSQGALAHPLWLVRKHQHQRS